MDDEQRESLESRVKRLEETVEELRQALVQKYKRRAQISGEIPEIPTPVKQNAKPVETPTPPPQPIPKPPPSPPRPTPISSPDVLAANKPRPARKQIVIPEHMRSGEYWLNKIGIGLLLFSVIFLFKYSVDQGWLTPRVRVAFGLALGFVLIILGLRIFPKRPHFSQVLLGGGIATFYITGFAAFQVFDLMPRSLALGFMITTTIGAFILSLKQDGVVLSLIGVLGGLGTPVFLYTGSESVSGFIIYTCLIIAGMSTIYFYKGWRSLLWISIIIGWMVFSGGIIVSLLSSKNLPTSDQWALQGGVIFGWFAFWAMPIVRDIAWIGNPSRWLQSSLGFGDSSMSAEKKMLLQNDLHVLTIFTPMIILGLSYIIWDMPDKKFWGWFALGSAPLYWLVARAIKGQGDFMKNLAYTHSLVGVALFTLALCLILEGQALFFALVTESAVLHLVAKRISNRGLKVSAHILFWAVGIWLGFRLLVFEPRGTPFINNQALTDIWAIALGLFFSTVLHFKKERRIYFMIAQLAITGLLARELNGNILFTIVSIQTVILHFIASIKSDRAITTQAHIFSVGIFVWLCYRLFLNPAEGTAIFNFQAITDIVIILSALLVSILIVPTDEKIAYRIAAHVALLVWFVREFSTLPNGQGYVTIAWGVYSVVLLIIGLRKNYNKLRIVALGTLALVIGKLFLVDLTRVKMIWRILLFMGFGGLFLILSYYFRAMWKSKPDTLSDNIH